MADLKKVTANNHLPGDGNDRFPVYSKQFNKLVDDLSDGTADVDANNVTVAGTLTVTGTTTLNGSLVLGDAAADALTVNATTTYAEPVNYSNATGITAFATGGQASATALTEEINNVTTCATAGDSVKLPAAVAGKHVWVKNSGATALDIFPASSDSINALAVNLAVRIQPGSSMHFYAKDATVWESDADTSITIPAPSTVKGGLEIKAADSAGNTITTITNASQAAARTYTVPDAGANAEFVMAAGTQTIAGLKTFSDPITQNDTSNQLILGVTNTTTLSATAPSSSRVYTMPDAGADASFQLSIAPSAIAIGTGFDGAETVKWIPHGRHGASGVIINEVILDITGLVNSTTVDDIIGETGAANCHFGQITAAIHGTVSHVEIVCLETPAGGDPDIDFYTATVETGTENSLITDLTETLLLARGASWANGDVRGATTVPPANGYLYLAVGAGGAPGTYSAGKFKVTFYGA